MNDNKTPLLNPLLISFQCVARSGSFNKAAQELFISTTAVRKQMNILEDELSLTLFHRDKKGIVLTEEGKSLYADLTELIALSNKIVVQARESAQKKATVFRLGTSYLNPASVLIDFLQKNGRLGDYSFQVIQFDDNREGILSEVDKLGEKYDFLVGSCSSKLWLQRCNFYKLGDYAICCAVPHGHRLWNKKYLTLKDLHGERVVLGKKGDSEPVDRARDILAQEKFIDLEDGPNFYDLDIFNKSEQESKILLTLECWKNVHPSFATIPVKWNCYVPFGIIYQINPPEKIVAFLKLFDQITTAF